MHQRKTKILYITIVYLNRMSYLLHDAVMMGHNVDIRVEAKSALTSNLRFGFTNMLLLKEKLSVEVANIDGVQINLLTRTGFKTPSVADNVDKQTSKKRFGKVPFNRFISSMKTYNFDILKTRQDEVLKNFTPNPTGADNKDLATFNSILEIVSEHTGNAGRHFYYTALCLSEVCRDLFGTANSV